MKRRRRSRVVTVTPMQVRWRNEVWQFFCRAARRPIREINIVRTSLALHCRRGNIPMTVEE